MRDLINKVKKINKILKENNEVHSQFSKKTGFWGKAGAGCLFYAKNTGRYLLAYRSSYVNEPNTWGTWGGAIDNEETPTEAVIREIKEEAGFDGEYEIKHAWTFESAIGFKYYNFIITVDDEFKPKLNWENSNYSWVEPDNWPSPLHPGLKAFIDNYNFKKKGS